MKEGTIGKCCPEADPVREASAAIPPETDSKQFRETKKIGLQSHPATLIITLIITLPSCASFVFRRETEPKSAFYV